MAAVSTVRGTADKGLKVIRWEPQEWRDVAMALAMLNPEYLRSPGCVINPTELMQAMKNSLPEDRQRPINIRAGATQFKERLHYEWKLIREEAGALLADEKSPNVTESSEAVIQTAYDDSVDDAKPSNVVPFAASNKDSRQRRVKWNDGDYLLMARWLRANYPAAGYVESSTAVGLELADIRQAMRAALTPARHRKLIGVRAAELREHFVTAFKAAKQVMYREAEAARLAEEQARHAEQGARGEEDTSLGITLSGTMESGPAPVPAMQDVQAAPAVNPYESAFAPLVRPLMALFAKELAAAFAPQVTAMVEQALAAFTTPAAPAPSTPAAPIAPVGTIAGDISLPALTTYGFMGPQVLAPKPEARARRPKVGLFGMLKTVAQEIEQAFPGIEFVTVAEDHTKTLAHAFDSCVKVIAFVKFISHPARKMLMNAYGDRVAHVTGASSEAKRLLGVWQHSGALQANA